MTGTDQAILIELAEAVKDRLNATDFGEPMEAQRLYVPRYELEDMDTLRVSVVPAGSLSELSSRNSTTDEYTIDIGVQKRFKTEDSIDLDPLVALTQAIADSFRFKKLDGMPSATWIKGEITPAYIPQHIEQYRQFTSVVRLTYRLIRGGA